jgi:hypothetical protein
MFKIEEIDPVYYRAQTRKSTMIIVAIFLVIGVSTARLAVTLLGEYTDSHMTLNFMGAFVGLLITFWIVNTFYKSAPWMQEAMYGWRLKRHVMYIYNAMRLLEKAVDQGDIEAIKIMRFYHLAQEQMYKLDNNLHELSELSFRMREHETKMEEMGIALDQTEFDMKQVDAYRNQP